MGRKGKGRERPAAEEPASAGPAVQFASRSSRSQDAAMRLLVFASGAVLMGLEIAGSRVLAPHFGNSVFVWGSLISVFLVALGLGYFFGGRLADRYPSHALLGGIGILVSLLIFLLAAVARRLCGAMADAGWGERSGPLAASMLLFLPPSLGMGMISPLAVRLAARSVASVGRIAGSLYAVSTAGSIAGTLLTTFVLIPSLGVATILKGLGLTLLLASAIALPQWRRGLAAAVVLGLPALAWSLWPGSAAFAAGSSRQVVDVDTPYHHITVVDAFLDNQETRLMCFDRHVQGLIVKSPPYPSPDSYTNYFHLAFLLKPKIEHALFIGAGAGIGPREFHNQDPQMEIDVVDIDPKVLELARKHFFLDDFPAGLPAGEPIKTIAQDGRMFLRRAESKYDCVVLDAFTAGGTIPFHLVTREFLELCREKMTADGIFVMNINSAAEGPLAGIFQSLHRTIESVFEVPDVFVMDRRHTGAQESTNIILLAALGKRPIAPEEWAKLAREHRSNSYVTADRLRQMTEDLLFTRPDTADAPLFTDDYAPIETMPY